MSIKNLSRVFLIIYTIFSCISLCYAKEDKSSIVEKIRIPRCDPKFSLSWDPQHPWARTNECISEHEKDVYYSVSLDEGSLGVACNGVVT